MLTDYVARGLKAGLAAGVVFAAFLALVGNPLVAGTEAVAHAGEHGHALQETPVVSGAVTNAVSVVSGALLGLLAGAAFGVAYFLLEPAIPGETGTKSYLLAAAGFVTVSGAPWLVLPPQPAGVEQTLPTDVRIAWYAGMMALGALVCGLAGYAHTRVARDRSRATALAAAALPFGLLAVPVLLTPANTVHGAVPDALVAAFRGVVLFGQLALWAVLAATHARLVDREGATDAHPEVAPGVTAD